MQTEADFEIINLNPNIIYEDSESDDDFVMDEEEEEKTDVNVLVEEIENNDSMQSNSNDSFGSLVENNVKRKRLNLQEYKIKRANQPAPVMINKKNVLELCEIIPDTLPSISLPTDPRAIKNFLNQISLNKQLELQQEQYQDEEQLIEQPVREEISVQQIVDIHPDYEEIVLVSIECNTDISIPPNEGEDMNADQSKTAIESKYLTNIVNNFEKNSNAKCLLANSSANSLFSSINAVLQEKCKSNSSSENDKRIENKSIVEHHGEDKFIMHLRKDRIRPLRSAISIQTDVTPLFPPLILSPALIFNRIKNIRSYRRRSSRSRSRSRSRSISPESDYYGHGNYNYHNSSDFNSRFAHSTYTSSMNSSEMESYSSDSDSSAYSSGRSSDQESIKRFDKYKNYRMFKQRNGISQAPYREERKIIYVGEIPEVTTKDELRRKFLKYGTIKKISIHAKNDGSLRYGFVTFAESSAAYDVLEKFSSDAGLSNYDLRFGGRRKFCKQTYADLDNEAEIINDDNNNSSSNNKPTSKGKPVEMSFEDLLNMTKQKLCNKK